MKNVFDSRFSILDFWSRCDRDRPANLSVAVSPEEGGTSSNRKSKIENRKSPWGFTLVEIVLALGIAAFCLVAILGLFSVGQMASREANNDTSLAAAASQVISKIRSQGNVTLPATYRFDYHGRLIASNEDDAVYICEVSSSPVPDTEIESVSIRDPANGTSLKDCLTRLKIEFTWPASVPPDKRLHTTTFHAMLAQP